MPTTQQLIDQAEADYREYQQRQLAEARREIQQLQNDKRALLTRLAYANAVCDRYRKQVERLEAPRRRRSFFGRLASLWGAR
jgi:chromosome segregation ATPase